MANGSIAVEVSRNGSDRFDRLMQARLKHDLVTEPKAALVLIHAAQHELKAWSKRTKQLGLYVDGQHDLERWSGMRDKWQSFKPRTRRKHQIGALEVLLSKNYRIIMLTATKYRGWGQRCGFDLSDLFDMGTLGFIRAVKKFNERKGSNLATYGILWMRAEIRRELHSRGRAVHVPYNVDLAAATASVSAHKFELLHGHLPDDTELAEQIVSDWAAKFHREARSRRRYAKHGKKPSYRDAPRKLLTAKKAGKRVEEYRSTPQAIFSLDTAVNFGHGDSTNSTLTHVDRLVDEGADVRMETAMIAVDELTLIRDALAELPEEERWVINERFLSPAALVDEPTLKELGQRIPEHLTERGGTLSRERVRQIQEAGFAKIRIRLARRTKTN